MEPILILMRKEMGLQKGLLKIYFLKKNRYLSTDFDSNFRPMTGKEARKSRSAKVKKNIEDGSLAYDEDFYK